MKEARLATFLALSGFFLFWDRLFKWMALQNPQTTHLLNPYFGWQPHFNPGVAFGIPLPMLLTIIFSIPTIALILYFTFIKRQWPILLIAVGALSNLWDRLFYQHTVDYILLLTGLINLSDVMIVGGLVFFIFSLRKSD